MSIYVWDTEASYIKLWWNDVSEVYVWDRKVWPSWCPWYEPNEHTMYYASLHNWDITTQWTRSTWNVTLNGWTMCCWCPYYTWVWNDLRLNQITQWFNSFNLSCNTWCNYSFSLWRKTSQCCWARWQCIRWTQCNWSLITLTWQFWIQAPWSSVIMSSSIPNYFDWHMVTYVRNWNIWKMYINWNLCWSWCAYTPTINPSFNASERWWKKTWNWCYNYEFWKDYIWEDIWWTDDEVKCLYAWSKKKYWF